MLAGLLGLGAGKTLTKYVIMGAAVIAVGFGLWLMVQSYNNAIEKAAEGEIKLQTANSETEAANANTEQVARMYAAQSDKFKSEQKRLNALARSRERRANGVSEELARIFNLMGGDADVADYQRLLLRQLERGQGEPFNREQINPDSPATSPSLPTTGVPFACFDQRTAKIMLSNATKNADFIEDVIAAGQLNNTK